jgi:hypothetical protein
MNPSINKGRKAAPKTNPQKKNSASSNSGGQKLELRSESEAIAQSARLFQDRVASQAADILPNRSLWVLPNGDVVDVETEGTNEDESAFSHGIFVRKWISSCVDMGYERRHYNSALKMRCRALEILEGDPSLKAEPDEEGRENPFSGDLAYNQAAEEQGWIRIKPMTRPTEKLIYAETLTGTMSGRARRVIEMAAERHGCKLVILSGGALANRAKNIALPSE